MKLKRMVVAMALGASSLAAYALPTPTSLDAISGPLTWKLQGVTTEFNTTAGTTETTWGLGRISEISSSGGSGSTNQIWQSGTTDGTQLYFMIYGIADLNIRDDGAGGFKIYNVGATGGAADGLIHIDLYRTASSIAAIDDSTADPLTRTGFGSDSLLAALGTPYLKVVMGTGKVLTDLAAAPLCDGSNGTFGDGSPCMTVPSANETLATLFQNTNGATLPASGDGNFFADVAGGTVATGGTAYAKWDTNFLSGHDFDGHFTLIPNDETFGGACTAAQLAANVCFTGNINDPLRSRALPEPGTLALLGGALFGLAGFGRRKKQ